MNTLVCPVSKERVNSTAVRMTALLVTALSIIYLTTGYLLIPFLLMVDFAIRAFTSMTYSPLSFVAAKTARGLRLPVKTIDKAPKIFAARVGFLFCLTTVLFHTTLPLLSIVMMSILITCALLEAVLDFCVGCMVYTYVVLPLNKRQ